jgi:hypothetical protein
MRETNLATAQSEYYKRPADERFASVAALVAAAQYDKDHSAERTYNLKDLKAVVEQTHNTETFDRTPEQEVLRLESPNGRAQLTHYAFGQLARTIGAPASYLRTLPPELAARNINHGLQESPAGTAANLLVRANGGTPTIRAATSDTYGRVWDASLYGELSRRFMDTDSRWITPPTWDGTPAGAYRGDRDSFVIVVNGGSIVTDPSLSNRPGSGAGLRQPTDTTGPTDGMFRGLMLRNSEVGHCSITIESILFRYICGNHMLWGAIMDRQFRRRHVGTKITRDTMRELQDLAWKFTNRTAERDEAIVRGLLDHEIAHTKEAVIDELKKMGATKTEAEEAYATCEAKEAASPRSFWGIAQGLTRNSQDSGYQDDRLQLDQLASLVLKRGAALVTV